MNADAKPNARDAVRSLEYLADIRDGTSDAALSETDLMTLLKGGANDGMPAAIF